MIFQPPLFELEPDTPVRKVKPFKTQLLKWIGNKQRFADEIISYFPDPSGTYYEPFLGSGGILGTLAPEQGIASDLLLPLIEIWQTLAASPATLKDWYRTRWEYFTVRPSERKARYETIKAAYNARPNGADLLFLSRSCYGGVVRFRKDGYMSTPCGVHDPISPEAFDHRVDVWYQRTKGVTFVHADFERIMDQVQPGDLVYCDPPYSDTQSILYGAQSFSLDRLLAAVQRCKVRGAYVALSIDGSKKTGQKILKLPIPTGLFEHEVMINGGRSMLRRFQMAGETLEDEVVADRLLLTY